MWKINEIYTNKSTSKLLGHLRTNTTPGANNNSSSTETTPSTSALDTADDLWLSETINRVFTKITLAISTVKDAIQKEARDCVIRNDEKRLKDISTYLHSYWRNMSVKHGCLCLDERKAIPNAIKDALLEYIHSARPGSFARLSFAQNAWWPYIHRDILSKASEYKRWTDIGKNLKPVIPHVKWSPLPNCIEQWTPNRFWRSYYRWKRNRAVFLNKHW